MAADLRPPRWTRDQQLWVEVFAAANFAGLGFDVLLAHAENQFRRESEFLPVYFSLAAAVLLAAILPLRRRSPAVWRDVGYLVGWSAVVLGGAGVLLHLDSRFFYERTIRSLTYAAPFAAPLAFTGLGLLLVVNRFVAAETLEWAQWVLLLALGGFVGNFVFSLTDHAQNAFFNPLEWVPVVSSACATGALIVPFLMRVTRPYLRLCAWVLGAQALVGLLGFALHVQSDVHEPGATLLERVLNGAPPMAPLLFPNLVILALIGLWALAPHLE